MIDALLSPRLRGQVDESPLSPRGDLIGGARSRRALIKATASN